MPSIEQLLADCDDLIERCEDQDAAIREMLLDLRDRIAENLAVDVSSN